MLCLILSFLQVNYGRTSSEMDDRPQSTPAGVGAVEGAGVLPLQVRMAMAAKTHQIEAGLLLPEEEGAEAEASIVLVQTQHLMLATPQLPHWPCARFVAARFLPDPFLPSLLVVRYLHLTITVVV